MHHGSGHLRCITHRTAERHNLRKQSANEQSVSSSSVSVLRERKPSDNLFIVKPAMHSLRSAGAQCKMWSRRRLQSKNGHGAHFMVYAQPFVTLTLFTRTPTSSRCTYEQKDDGDGGFTKALNSPARSGDAHTIRSAAAMRASKSTSRDAIFRTLSKKRYSETYRRDTLRKSGDETRP